MHREKHSEPPAQMLAVYEYLHQKHIEKAKEIKIMQSQYREGLWQKVKEASKRVPLFVFMGVARGVTEGNCAKFEQIIAKEKFRKLGFFPSFPELFGGDKRDRTADLLNAIAFYEVTV